MSERDEIAAVLAAHVAIKRFFGLDLYRKYACACGWYSTVDQQADLEAHVADALLASPVWARGVLDHERAETFKAELIATAEALREAEAAVERVRALADAWERDDADHIVDCGQHLAGGAVLCCAEYLRAALDPPEGISGAQEGAEEPAGSDVDPSATGTLKGRENATGVIQEGAAAPTEPCAEFGQHPRSGHAEAVREGAERDAALRAIAPDQYTAEDF